MTQVHILILAAGASSRMAPRDKLTETIEGEPLLRRTTRIAVATGAPVTVVLAPDRPGRTKALDGLNAHLVVAKDAHLGMSASLGAGIAALPQETSAIMILPADMAALTTADLARILLAAKDYPGHIIRGTTEDVLEGHPVLFPASLFPALKVTTGDEGGRAVIKANRHLLRLIPLPGNNALLDLDTPEDWAAFRASGGN